MLLNLLIDAGVLVVYSLNMPRVIRIMPPAIMSEEQMAFVLDAMDRAARATEEVASEL
jgi:acetylornithine/succinyldiaminopimelate/putrescine aminotransferase